MRIFRPLVFLSCCALFFPASVEGSFINYKSKEINAKVVYYGPDGGGMNKNLKYIYARTSPKSKGKLIELKTGTESTQFFDFLPLSLGEIRGFKTRFHLYTVPGGDNYSASRKLILKGVDGVVFLFDARPGRFLSSMRALSRLRDELTAQGYDLAQIPLVIQVEHADDPGAQAPNLLCAAKGLTRYPCVASRLETGEGVFVALKQAAKLILMGLKKAG